MTTTVPVELDPVHSAVSRDWETQHIVGTSDGEHLMINVAARASTCADNVAAMLTTTATTTRTLGDARFQFFRIEVDEHGRVKKAGTVGGCGKLARYFARKSASGAAAAPWHHADNPAGYADDFPFSVDNFDCERLVGDLEDDNDLLDRDVTRWVLWAGLGQTTAAAAAAPGPPTVFAARRRIALVRDLLAFLHEVRLDLQAIPASTPAPPPVLCFIVGVSYTTRFRAAGAAPATGGTMMAAPLTSTLTFFTNMMQKKQQQQQQHNGRPLSSASSSTLGSCGDIYSRRGSFDGDNDNDNDNDNGGGGCAIDDNDSLPPTSAPNSASPTMEKLLLIPQGQPVQWAVRRNSRGELYYAPYVDDDEYQRAMAENYARYEAEVNRTTPLTRWPFLLTDDPSEPSQPPSPDHASPPSLSSPSSPASASPPAAAAAAAAAALPPSLLATLDTNAAKGDAVEGDLHALLPEAQSPSEEAWRQCCALLCLDPEAHKDAQARSIKVPGTDNMWVKPSQLWTAYWMLSSRLDRELCGGVLADVMGTGKTYICLLVCLLRAYIGYNRAEVEREWQLREHEAKKGAGGGGGGGGAPKQHLPRDAAGDTPCSCGNAMGIECYANPGGITRRLADSLSRGVSLILAPHTVLDNWVKTVKHVRLQHRFFEPVVFHSKMTKEDTVMAPAPRLKQKLQMEVRPEAHVGTDGLFPASWQPDVRDVVHGFVPSVAKDAFPERFLFLATHMPEKLTEFFQLPVPLRRSGGGAARERKTVYGCPVGIQIVDEFHKAKGDVVALAQQHKHMQQGGGKRDDFDFWAVTGTPLPARLTDLEPATELVQRLPAWDDPGSRHHGGRVADLRALQVAYDQAVAEDGTAAQAADFRARAARFFAGGLVKRHTEASTFFGQRIFQLQDVTPAVVVHATPAALRADVQRVAARVGAALRASLAAAAAAAAATAADEAGAGGPAASAANWEQAVRSLSLFNHMLDLEVVATFPGAARLLLAEPPALDFGLAALRAEIRQAKDRDVTQVALFQRHLDTVIEGSPHVQTILATLDAMDRDKQRRRALPTSVAAGVAGNGRTALPAKKLDAGLKKLVVLCPRMGEAVFVFLALRKLRPDARAVFLHADLKMSERTALLHDFNRLDAAGAVPPPRVLVGTFRDAGTGNDLTVANYQILTGPLRLRSHQDQAFGRTNREGQTLRLHHQLLVAEDSPVDRIVIATQARRRIASDPFDMDAPLELVEPVEEAPAGES